MMYEQGANGQETPGIEDYLAAIRLRRWLVLLCLIGGIVASLFFASTRAKTYEASAKVLVNPTNVATTDNRLQSPVLEREREVIASNAVASLAVQDLGISLSPLAILRELEVVFVDKSDSLEILFKDGDAEFARDVANSFAINYVDKRNGEAQDLDSTQIAEFQSSLDSIDEQIDSADARAAELANERAQFITLGDTGAATRALDELTSVRSLISSLRGDRRTVAADLSDAQIAASTRTLPAEVLQLAATPTIPAGLSDNIVVALGALLGLGTGVGLAFILYRLDRTARESGDVELALGTSVLGSLPSFGVANRSGSSSIVMLSGGRSAKVQRARESFRRLRSSIQFLGSTRESSAFLLTSARPAEGKSTISANLAIALSQGESKVCLVNADLRRPTLEKLFQVSTNLGLSDYLADPKVTNILVPLTDTPGLVLVPAGAPPANPGELLATRRFADLIEELAEQFDVVLIDAPPVLSAADASSIASSVDGTIIVVDSHRTETDTLLRVRAEIDRAGGEVVGAILNRDDSDTGSILRKDRYAYERATASRSNN
jgi:capsular exopolysaccharide synthesis family protein